MPKPYTKWRISDVIRAVCKERRVGWNPKRSQVLDSDAVYLLRARIMSDRRLVLNGSSFEDVLQHHAPYSLPRFFGQPSKAYGALFAPEEIEALAKVIVDHAIRLKVPKRAR